MPESAMDTLNSKTKLASQVIPLLSILTHLSAQRHENDAEPEDLEEIKEEQKRFATELGRYTQVKSLLRNIDGTVRVIETAKEEVDTVTVDKERDQIVSNVDKKVASARKDSRNVKNLLMGKDSIKTNNESFAKELKSSDIQGSVEMEIRSNLYNYYVRKYFLTHKRYTTLAAVFEDRVRTRTKRALKYLSNKLTDEEADALIDQGKDKEYLEAQMNGDDQEFKRLIAQSDKAKNLNREVNLLKEMFMDMAALVDQQQETVENITEHISATLDYTGQAAVELGLAAGHLLAARKKMVCIAIICFVVIVVVLVIILAASGAFKKEGE